MFSGGFTGGLLYLAYFFGIVALAVALFSIARAMTKKEESAAETLSHWGSTVPFSPAQLGAMRSLWQAYKSGRDLTDDPLRRLDPVETADLLKKCGAEYLPSKYRLSDEARECATLKQQLEERGVDSLHAEVIVGMLRGRLGPANDL